MPSTTRRRGLRLAASGGAQLEEWVGLQATATRSVSLRRAQVPPRWHGPRSLCASDRVIWVLQGELTLLRGRRRQSVARGEAGLVPGGEEVELHNRGARRCEYLLFESPAAPASSPNRVELSRRHPRPATANGVKREAQRFLQRLGLEGCELSLSLVGDDEMQRLNRQWRHKDKPTDVLSFPADPLPPGTPGLRPLGDIVISLDTTVRQAAEFGRSAREELSRYLAHGLLHLLGYDHVRPADARAMASAEERLLGREGMVPAALRR